MIRWRRRSVQLPYAMFDAGRSGLAARTARKLENIYHMGQDKAWAGRSLLEQLVQRHGPPRLPEAQKKALGRIFAIIMWGELAAWRVAAQLADRLEPLEAKLAATSQAHDEARHFYVMHEYLTLCDALPRGLDAASERVLHGILAQTNLAKKLLGMQLLVEPAALSLFQVVRQLRIEPVLSDLMPYYERDEARHVGLGIQYLPTMARQMTFAEQVDLVSYMARVTWWLMQSLTEIREDLETLGIHPREFLDLVKGKNLRAFRLLFSSMGMKGLEAKTYALGHLIEPLLESRFPPAGESTDWWRWVRRTGTAFWKGATSSPEGTLEVA